jgi:LacI family transcriptional regulator
MAQIVTRKTPVILEIARKANVSRAAAYAVLNSTKPSTIGVSEEKRRRVLEVAKEFGYVRNELARSLVTGKTFTIGVLVHSLKNHFFTDFFTCLDDLCYQAGYSASFANSEFNPDREARHLRAFLAKKVDALVIVRDPFHRNEDLLKQVARQEIPVITIGELADQNLLYPNVTFDEALGDRLAAEFLWTQGHRKILYFSAGKTTDSLSLIQHLRWENFSAAWTRLTGDPILDHFQTTDTIHGGNELGEYLAKLPAEKRPSAVACSTDRLAISLISALRVHNLRVPEDMSVIGFDDIDAAAELAVPLTTVRLPTQKLAQSVWTLLQKNFQDPQGWIPSRAPECMIVDPELIVRKSVKSLIHKV